MYAFVISHKSDTCYAHLNFVYLINLIIFKKLLIMQFSLSSNYFLSQRSKYFRQYTFLNCPQSMFFPCREKPSFTPIQNDK